MNRQKILQRFDYIDTHTVSTPLDLKVTLFKGCEEGRFDDIKECQAIVGSIMYLIIGSRPDLAYSVTLLCQFASCPNINHPEAAKRTLRYLAGTDNWDPIYLFGSNKLLEIYADVS